MDGKCIDAPASEEIPLTQHDGATIKKAATYCELVQFKNEVPFERQIKEDMKFEDVVKDAKEREFILALSDEDLFKLVVLANFLNIRRLFELCCARLAYAYRGILVW